MFKLFHSHCVGVASIHQVALSHNEPYGYLTFSTSHFAHPLSDMLEGGSLVAGDANEEDVSAVVSDLSVAVELLVAARVMYLYVDLSLFDTLNTSIDIKNGRLILISERVL